jgi:WD40 repeat protein
MTGHSNWVRSLTTLLNGDLASGSYDTTINIWNPIDATLKKTLKGHSCGVYSLTTLLNGDLASGSADTTIKIWSKMN